MKNHSFKRLSGGLKVATWAVNGPLQSFTCCENQLYKNVCFLKLNFEQESFIQASRWMLESCNMSCQCPSGGLKAARWAVNGSLQSFASCEKQLYKKHVFIQLNFEQESLIQAPKWRLESRKMSCQWVIAKLHKLRKSAVEKMYVFIQLKFEQDPLIQAPKWRLESRKMSCQWVIAQLHKLRK